MNIEDLKNAKCFVYVRTNNGNEGIGIQENILQDFLNENDINGKFYIDGKCNGLDFNRPAFKLMMQDIEKNDKQNKAIVVTEIGRISKNARSIVELLENKKKHIKIYSVFDRKYIDKKEIISTAIKKYYERPNIAEVLGNYAENDIRVLLKKIIIDKNKNIIVPKNELFTGEEKQMIKELKEKWKSPCEINEIERIAQAKKMKSILAEDEDMEM